MTDPADDRPGLHGRRKGRPLSPTRAALVARLLPELGVDLAAPPPADARALFAHPVEAVRLEIGCGAGEHLVHEAAAHPGTGFIGVEPFEEGMASILAAAAAAGLRNVRVFTDDAALLLDWLPPASLTRVDLLYPDPWPKRRHWKRRFVQPANLTRIARALSSGGEFRVASDIAAYIDWTLQQTAGRPDLLWTATGADDWRRPWAGWPGTRYERKALAAARPPAYLIFRRA